MPVDKKQSETSKPISLRVDGKRKKKKHGTKINLLTQLRQLIEELFNFCPSFYLPFRYRLYLSGQSATLTSSDFCI
jgi:hypothetical protein